MKALKNAIETRGHFINDEVLKVDAFLNHQIDCSLVDEMGNEFYEHFKNKGITKVVTIESSGIAPAYATAIRLNVPLIFIKKTQPSTISIQLLRKSSLSQRIRHIQFVLKKNT